MIKNNGKIMKLVWETLLRTHIALHKRKRRGGNQKRDRLRENNHSKPMLILGHSVGKQITLIASNPLKLQQAEQVAPKYQIPPKNLRNFIAKSSLVSKPVGKHLKKKYVSKTGKNSETSKSMDIRRYLGSCNKFTTQKNVSLGGESKS